MREKELLKAIPEYNQPIAKKNTELAITTLKIAEQNLHASIILFDNHLYPEAIYFLQQSIEKACKSFSFKLGIITEKEATEISHSPSKIYSRIVKQFGGELSHTKKRLKHLISDKKPELVNQFVETLIQEINELEKDSKQLEEEIGLMSKNKSEYSVIDEDKLVELLEKCKNLPESVKNEKEDVGVLFDAIININSLNTLGVGIDPDDKQLIDEVTRSMQGKQKLEIFMSLDALAPLLMLAIITQQHENATRYVINNNNPLIIYNDNHPLVKNYNKIQSLMSNTISSLYSRYIEIDSLDI